MPQFPVTSATIKTSQNLEPTLLSLAMARWNCVHRAIVIVPLNH